MKNSLSNSRPGTALVMAIGGLLVTSLLGVALIDRSINAGRAGKWSRDHLELRHLAESGVEELFARASEESATPGAPLFEALRRIPPGGAFKPLTFPMRTPALEAEVARDPRASGVRITATATVLRISPISPDPLERVGILRLEVELRSGMGPIAVTERVRADRSFKVARVTPPRPLDQVGLFVAISDAASLPGARPGGPVYATIGGTPRTLQEIYTLAPAEGLHGLPAQYDPVIGAALGSLGPVALTQRAHYVVRTPAELLAFLASRQGKPVDGLIHCSSTDPLRLDLPEFRGKCMLSSAGPIELGTVRMKDPARDLLTIVSAQRIVVKGPEVQAALVSIASGTPSVLFATTSVVRGAVISARFPGRSGLPASQFANCQIAYDRALHSGLATEAAADDKLLSRYVCCFSPHPVQLVHARDGEGWTTP